MAAVVVVAVVVSCAACFGLVIAKLRGTSFEEEEEEEETPRADYKLTCLISDDFVEVAPLCQLIEGKGGGENGRFKLTKDSILNLIHDISIYLLCACICQPVSRPASQSVSQSTSETRRMYLFRMH